MSMHAVDNEQSPGSVVYRRAIEALLEAGVPFMVGGAYALQIHTPIVRHTKDFDIFVLPEDVRWTLEVLAAVGFETELILPHWLGKAHWGEDLIDVIFNSGNGVCMVDANWFAHATSGKIFDLPALFCPVEETIWQKAFILERDRCDSADVAHLLRDCGAKLDWRRLLGRFGQHWQVLYAHLVLLRFIYSDSQSAVPDWVWDELAEKLDQYLEQPVQARVCRGTLFSVDQYAHDIEVEGYTDVRLRPLGNLTPGQIQQWTEHFEKEADS